jgi:hypothetical protein
VQDYAAYQAIVPVFDGGDTETTRKLVEWIKMYGTKMGEGEARIVFTFPSGRYRA